MKTLEIESWTRRIHETEGTVRYDGGPLVITPHKGQIHIPGSTRRAVNAQAQTDVEMWNPDTLLTVNGVELGHVNPPWIWGGGGLGWKITPDEIEAIVPDAVRNPRQVVDWNTIERTVLLPDGVMFAGQKFPLALPPFNAFERKFMPEPKEPILGTYDDPIYYDDCVALLRQVFEEEWPFSNNFFLFKNHMQKSREYTAWEANEKRWKLLDAAYDKECRRLGNKCTELWVP